MPRPKGIAAAIGVYFMLAGSASCRPAGSILPLVAHVLWSDEIGHLQTSFSFAG